MKNYGLQVKEIPIIFRGTIPGSLQPETLTIEKVNDNGELLSPDMPNIFRWKLGDDDTLTADVLKSLTTINVTITIDGETNNYENVDHWWQDEDTTLYIGSEPGIFDQFPFFVQIMENENEDDFNIVALAEYEGSDENPDLSIVIIGQIGEPVTSNAVFSADLTGNGQINHFRARFACGENGTLHLHPYVILNGNIRVDLCNFAQGGDQYIAGDNEEIEFDCYVPIETHAVAYVEAENTGEYPSLVDAAMTVQYEDFIECESIVGYEGVNLRRGRR